MLAASYVLLFSYSTQSRHAKWLMYQLEVKLC